MGRSQESFNKKEVQKKKEKKRKDKLAKKLEKKEGEKKSMDDMIAYVDAYGNITSEPPDRSKEEEIDPETIEVNVAKSISRPEDKLKQGIVTNYNDSKGFGFIRDNNTKESLFFHVNNTLDDIGAGDKVIFESEKGLKGPVAVNVKLNK